MQRQLWGKQIEEENANRHYHSWQVQLRRCTCTSSRLCVTFNQHYALSKAEHFILVGYAKSKKSNAKKWDAIHLIWIYLCIMQMKGSMTKSNYTNPFMMIGTIFTTKIHVALGVLLMSSVAGRSFIASLCLRLVLLTITLLTTSYTGTDSWCNARATATRSAFALVHDSVYFFNHRTNLEWIIYSGEIQAFSQG